MAHRTHSDKGRSLNIRRLLHPLDIPDKEAIYVDLSRQHLNHLALPEENQAVPAAGGEGANLVDPGDNEAYLAEIAHENQHWFKQLSPEEQQRETELKAQEIAEVEQWHREREFQQSQNRMASHKDPVSTAIATQVRKTMLINAYRTLQQSSPRSRSRQTQPE